MFCFLVEYIYFLILDKKKSVLMASDITTSFPYSTFPHDHQSDFEHWSCSLAGMQLTLIR